MDDANKIVGTIKYDQKVERHDRDLCFGFFVNEFVAFNIKFNRK